jgi:predicted transcriptional regulator
LTTNSLQHNEVAETTNQLSIDHQSIDSQLDHNKNTISSHVTVKSIIESHLPIWKHLGPAQSSVLLFLYKKCDFKSLETELLRKKQISIYCNISEKSVGTTIARLVKNEFVQRLKGRRGVSGYMQFSFQKEVYKKMKLDGADVIQISEANKNTISSQLDVELEHNKESGASSMYVCNNKNTIHTAQPTVPDEDPIDLWSELYDVDFSPLANWNIRSVVVDTFKKNKWMITREQLEEHLDRFVRYFTEKEFEKRRESIKNPYSFFLSSIKAISKGEPDPICDIKTQFEIAQQIALQNKLKEMEIRRREFEALEKQLDQYKDSEFENWSAKLGDDEKSKFVPPTKMAELGSTSHKILLKNHFTQNIWPNIKQSVLNGPNS